jgi:hypothetical protein
MSAEFQTVVKLRTLNWAMLLLGFAGIGFVSYRRRPTITNRKLGPAAKSSRVMLFNSWATVPEYTREATLPFLQAVCEVDVLIRHADQISSIKRAPAAAANSM